MPDKEDPNEGLLRAIEAAESESYGSGNNIMDGQLSDERAQAIDAYFGKNTNPAPDGNSQVVSRDLFDTIEWITPSLVRIFAGSDEVVKFNPVGPEDEPAAKQESMYINHVVTQNNQWTQICHDWIKDALLTKNAYCMAYYEETKHAEYEMYGEQSDDSFALLMQDKDDYEVIEHSQEVDEDQQKLNEQQYQQQLQQYQQMMMQAQQTGQPLPPPPQMPPTPMLHSVKLRRTEKEGKVCLRVLPPERCMVHHLTPDYTLKNCDFFEYWEEVTISSLRQMGFDIPDDIDADSMGTQSETTEELARDLYQENRSQNEGWEPSMRKVRARSCWIRHDYDDDGIAELQYALVVGNEVLYREEATRIPVASIVATPVPHRHVGISIADVMMEIQDTKQAMLRQGIDNLFHANNPRMFVADGKINIDDALVSRPGGIIRGLSGQDAAFGRDIAPVLIPNIFPQAVQGMEYMDRISERRTGVNGVFSGNVSPEVLTQTTGMAMSQMGTAAAQKVEQIARMIAPSVEYLFGCVHELILKHGHKEEVVKLENNWVVVDPRQWKTRKDLSIAVGLGSGNKDAVLGHLNQMFQMQMALLPMGVTDPKLIYNTVAEISKMAGFGSPDLFWKIPGPQPPPPENPEITREKMRIGYESQKSQQLLQAEQQKFQAESSIEMQKLRLEADQKDKDREAELEKARMDDATKLAIAELQANSKSAVVTQQQSFEQKKISDAIQQKNKVNGVAQVQSENEQMVELMKNLHLALNALVDAAHRPRIAVRDPKTGKPLYGRPMTDEEMAAARQ